MIGVVGLPVSHGSRWRPQVIQFLGGTADGAGRTGGGTSGQGVGGVFFKSSHPRRLALWYSKHLGFALDMKAAAQLQAREHARGRLHGVECLSEHYPLLRALDQAVHGQSGGG